MSENKKTNGIIILVVICILSVVAAITGVVLFASGRLGKRADESIRGEEAIETEDSLQDAEGEEQDKETEEGSEAEEVDEFTYLVCVPADYMSLRSSAGLGDDVISNLRAGTYLKWRGKTETIDEYDYYYVEVEDTGQEGYVAARFCVNVDFSYDEKELTIVDAGDETYSYDDMVTDIRELKTQYPDLIDYETIASTVDGREIYALTFGGKNPERHIMLQASIHGREYVNTLLVMRLLEYYCKYYETGNYKKLSYKDLFEKTAFHIIPMANPDGVSISQFGASGLNNPSILELLYQCYQNDMPNLCKETDSNGDPLWVDHYKDESFDLESSVNPQTITFDEYLTLWKANANAVDLNNNFDVGWDELDLKPWQSYGNFKGPYPVSEPESQALVNYALKYDYGCYISYHSRGQLIYYDVVGNSSGNKAMSTKLSELFKEQLKYDTVKTTSASNVNLGGFGDWIQLGLDKPSITIESGKKPCPLPMEEFPGIWNRHRESWAMIAEQFY